MKNKKNGMGKSMSYAIFNLLGYFVSIISLPILTNLFNQNDFGVITTIEANIALLISLFLLGIPQSYIRFYNKYKVKDELDKFNYNVFVLLIAVFILNFLISFATFNYLNKEARNLTWLLALIVAFSVAVQQLSSVLRAKEKTFLHAMILGVNNVLGYGLPILFVWLLGTSTSNYFISKLLVPLIIIIFIVFIIRKDMHIAEFDMDIIKEILKFGVPLILVSIGTTIFGSGDRLIIKMLLGNESVAVYSVASKITHAIQQVIIFPINMVLFPMYIRIWEEQGKKATEEVLSKWMTLYCFIAAAIILGSFSIREELIVLLSNKEYLDGAILIPMLCGGFLIYGCYYFVSAGFFVKNKTLKLGVIMTFCSILNLGLDYIGAKLWGINGVALATAICYVLFLVISYYASKDIVTAKIRVKIIIKFVITALIMSMVLSIIPNFNSNIVSLIIKMLIGATVYLLLNIKYVKYIIKNSGEEYGR